MRIVNLRTSEINLFFNLQLFYWHFLEVLWSIIFLILVDLSAAVDNFHEMDGRCFQAYGSDSSFDHP